MIPDILRSSLSVSERRILAPHLGLSSAMRTTSLAELEVVAGRLGRSAELGRRAAELALARYAEYCQQAQALGRAAHERARSEATVIIAGRPYAACSPDVNLSLPRKIVSRGYNAAPADILPPSSAELPARDVWAFTQQISNALNHAAERDDLYVCLLSCFSCGPDASMVHHFREMLSERVFCYLEIDTHTAHAGFDTRLGAFLDIVERHRRTHAARQSGRVATTAQENAAPGASYGGD